MTKETRIVPVRVAPPDYEQRVIDVAKKALLDLSECMDAKYGVRWVYDGARKQSFPVLVVELPSAEGARAANAIGIGLVRVKDGTLLDADPDKKLEEGDRLRDHIVRSVHRYLNHHQGVPKLLV